MLPKNINCFHFSWYIITLKTFLCSLLLYCNCQIQKALGCKRNPLAYDITAACSGFVLGLVSAACHIRGNGFVFIAVVGSDFWD